MLAYITAIQALDTTYSSGATRVKDGPKVSFVPRARAPGVCGGHRDLRVSAAAPFSAP
jgi:hypothetical protein